MLFSSMTFIYIFLPILLFLYLVTKKELHNPILLAASIIFYAWGEPKYLAIMLMAILINYLGAICIECAIYCTKEEQSPLFVSSVKRLFSPKLILVCTIIANLSFLVYFKYFNFLVSNANSLFGAHLEPLDIIMPIGISFYTFQALSYVIDVYRGEVKVQKDLYKLALYICLFPQLIAGPIVKYHDIEEQITSREVNFAKVNEGVKRFIIGLSKKVLIANTMALIADKIFSQSPDAFGHAIAWLGAIAYTFQIYFDFSGYSDMAIGLGLIFGFRFLENFNYPYISKSITEFWRRWHISLSTWFKQYVYISLGGNRNGLVKTCRNLGIVFLLTGIWHGAAWNFVFWGIWHGFFIILEKVLNIKEFEKKKHPLGLEILRHIGCILVFVIGWVLFRSDSLHYAANYILNMFGLLKAVSDAPMYGFGYYVDTVEIIAFIAAILCSMPIFKNMIYTQNKLAKAFVNFWLLVMFVLSTVSIAAGTYNPFIYFRF
ncbi:MAG: MBOAT family protein [bacterium]|nr:MBOAT family protein [bacterium]